MKRNRFRSCGNLIASIQLDVKLKSRPFGSFACRKPTTMRLDFWRSITKRLASFNGILPKPFNRSSVTPLLACGSLICERKSSDALSFGAFLPFHSPESANVSMCGLKLGETVLRPRCWMRKRRSPGARACNGSTWTVMTISKPQSLCIRSAGISRANVITTTRKPHCFFAKISEEDSPDVASRRSDAFIWMNSHRRAQRKHYVLCALRRPAVANNILNGHHLLPSTIGRYRIGP